MKVLVVLSAILACALAKPGFSYSVAAPVLPYAHAVNPWAVNTWGAHAWGAHPYAAPWAHSSYAIPAVTPSGYLLDTPEVAHAKAAHFAEVAAARLRTRRSLLQTPASTTPLVHAPVAPIVSYAAAPAPVLSYSAAHASVLPYAAHASVLPYSAAHASVLPLSAAHVPALSYAPSVYSSPIVSPAVIPAPAVRAATLTTIVNNPGHAVSYRVD